MDRGSRWEKASSGFVSALTKRRRYCPGFPESRCAIESGARMASSSCPPVEIMPVTTRGALASPALISSVWPAITPARRARLAPTTASATSSPNHRPSTRQPGFVEATPVLNVPPPLGTVTSCRYQVPIRVAWNALLAPATFMEVSVTGTSRNGAKPTTLLRQKMVFSFPSSASGKNTPDSTGR